MMRAEDPALLSETGRPLRIIHLVENVASSGIGAGPLAVAVSDCRELRRRGHDVVLTGTWSGRSRPPADIDGVPARLFRAPTHSSRPGAAFAVTPSLGWWLLREAPKWDVLHVHASRSLDTMMAIVIATWTRMPILSQTHGMIAPDERLAARAFDAVFTRRLLRRVTTALFLTPRERRDLESVIGGSVRFVEMPNGVAVATHCRRRMRTHEPADILFLARLQSRKRPLAFVEAAHALVLSGVKARFAIVGPDGGERDAVVREIVRRGLTKSVVYEGALPSEAVAERMASATVYVLPSVDEPFPMTLLEALSLGVPSICTTRCGLAGPLETVGAVLVAEPEVEPLARAMQRLIEDERLRERLSDAGIHATRTTFGIAGVVDRLQAEYRAAAAGRRGRRR